MTKNKKKKALNLELLKKLMRNQFYAYTFKTILTPATSLKAFHICTVTCFVEEKSI